MSSPRILRAADPRSRARRTLAKLGVTPAGEADLGHEELVLALESESARQRFPEKLTDLVAELYRQWEDSPEASRADRHRFYVVIPVADRPRMIRDCLHDLVAEQDRYRYGSNAGRKESSVHVVLVEDGADPRGHDENRRLVEEIASLGVGASYWGLREQEEVLSRIPQKLRSSLTGLGAAALTPAKAHKGATATRNIALLMGAPWMDDPRSLLWFVDSDEQWQTSILSDAEKPVLVKGFSFFHRMDHLFRREGIDVLTAHVTGDPPVSPGVMVRCFMEDLAETVNTIEGSPRQDVCPFHRRGSTAEGHSASYHDFADLFGYPQNRPRKTYGCRLGGAHDRESGLMEYGKLLNGFFFGHHPTRQTHFDPGQPLGESVPARTVYTGNAVFGSAMRGRHFPFAALGLRMAGPVYGRLLRETLGPRFKKANLPLLHRRTLPGLAVGEHRNGVRRSDTGRYIDLRGEFARQFWGDVLLFGIEELCAQGFPRVTPEKTRTRTVLSEQYRRLVEAYDCRTRRIDSLVGELTDTLGKEAVKNGMAGVPLFEAAVARCVETVRRNFGSGAPAVAMLREDGAGTGRMLTRLEEAIGDLSRQDALWSDAVEKVRRPGP